MSDLAEIITEAARLDEVLDELLQAPCVSLDVESDGFYNYRDRVCIVTLSRRDKDYIVDTLAIGDMSSLQRLVGRSDVPCLMHSGNNDVLALKRAYGFEFGLIQDTAVAGTLLGYAQTGLATLVETFVGVSLPKALQRHNWSARPIEPEQAKYLVNDTRHLFEVHEGVLAELASHDLIDEYEIECREVARAVPREREFDPERFRRIRGQSDLDDAHRGILRALYVWRDELARDMDRAPFRVISDATLLQLAQEPPEKLHDLGSRKGVGERLHNGHGARMLEVIRDGKSAPVTATAPPKRRKGEAPRRLDSRERDILGRLKRWREKETAARGLGLQAVLPTPVMHGLVVDPPKTIEQIAEHPRIGRSRAARYGEEILKILGR